MRRKSLKEMVAEKEPMVRVKANQSLLQRQAKVPMMQRRKKSLFRQHWTQPRKSVQTMRSTTRNLLSPLLLLRRRRRPD